VWYHSDLEHPFKQGIEDSDWSAELPIRRVCAKRGCHADARAGRGRLCRAHHAIATKRWRERRRQAGESVAGASAAAPSSSPDAVRARVALSRARKLGKAVIYPCVVCTRHGDVIAVHPDPNEPSKIVWACRGCRHVLLQGRDERRAAEAAAAADRENSRRVGAELEATLALLPTLPPATAEKFRAVAALGPAGLTLHPQSPMYRQRLAGLIGQFFSNSS
jgi:hypothetical protein